MDINHHIWYNESNNNQHLRGVHMCFVSNQQLSLFDSLYFLSERKQRMLEKSWAKSFSDHIFLNIDEYIFAPLFSEKTNSRPNAPINVIVAALILKEITGMTDDEIMEACEFDFRFQFALHTVSFENQPISDRTFSRFRSRCAAYELTTGKDLIHECIISLSRHICEFMELDGTIKRMDSMMIESNIRRMGRLELLYTCISNLVKEIYRDDAFELPDTFKHYSEPNDRNKVIYHDKETPQSEKLQQVINDASNLLELCKDKYSETSDYQLLERAVNEQTKPDPDDDKNRIPKDKNDSMDSSVLQNPSDPDATFRAKAGKSHRGYVANITETVDENGSVITEYQYDVNTHSDSSFVKDYIEEAPNGETTALIADGAYDSTENRKLAADKNIGLITTGLSGRMPREIIGDFTFSEDGKNVESCPNGNSPKSSNYIKQSDSVRISFEKDKCEGCPYRDKCRPKIKTRTASMIISKKSHDYIKQIREWHSNDTLQISGRIRNGAETVPSVMRRKYNVDHMPVRGKLRTKQFFGFKVAASNFVKLHRYTLDIEKCIPLQ